MSTKKTKRPYSKPNVVSAEVTSEPTVLLLCTGAYNCVGEIGYDCCAPSVDNCFDPGQC